MPVPVPVPACCWSSASPRAAQSSLPGVPQARGLPGESPQTRLKTAQDALEAGTDGDEPPSSGRCSCGSISWESCCWSELGVDLRSRKHPLPPLPCRPGEAPTFSPKLHLAPKHFLPARVKPILVLPLPPPPRVHRSLAHRHPQPLSVPRESAPSHCWLPAPDILEVSSPAPPPLPPPFPIPPFAKTKLFHGVFLYRGISCSPCDPPEPGAVPSSVHGHMAESHPAARPSFGEPGSSPRFPNVTCLGVQAAPGSH